MTLPISHSLMHFGQCQYTLFLQADVSGTIVKWLVDNGSQITPGQVCQRCCVQFVVIFAIVVLPSTS